MKWLNRFIHKLAHLVCWNQGKVITFEEDGFICVGFECGGCGEISPDSISKIESEKIYGK